MNHIKSYKIFESEVGYVSKPIDIKFDIKTSKFDYNRNTKYRHGIDRVINDDEIIEIVERGMEKLTIDLMNDNLDIGDRFVLKGEGFDGGILNLVCQLNPGENFFTLIIITAMRKEDFTGHRNQYILNVDTQEHYYK